MRYAAKIDGNHAAVGDVLRAMLADHVTDSSRWGEGAPDYFCSFGQYCCWVEVKLDAKASLTPAQIRFRRTHEGVYFRADNIDHAKAIATYIRHQASALAMHGDSLDSVRQLSG